MSNRPSPVGPDRELLGSPFEYSYELTEAEVSKILEQELRDMTIKPGKLEVVRTTNGNSPLANVARRKEATIFGKSFGNTVQEMHEIYGNYEDKSRFYLVLVAGDDGKIDNTGVLRVIMSPLEESITAKTIPDGALREDFDLAKIYDDRELTPETVVWDIGTLAVDEEFRGSRGKNRDKASLLLYRALYGDMVRDKIEFITAMLDSRALKSLRSIGLPMKSFSGVTEQFEYYGSKRTSAVVGHVPEFRNSVLGRSFEGGGLNGERMRKMMRRLAVFAFLLSGEKIKVKDF